MVDGRRAEENAAVMREKALAGQTADACGMLSFAIKVGRIPLKSGDEVHVQVVVERVFMNILRSEKPVEDLRPWTLMQQSSSRK